MMEDNNKLSDGPQKPSDVADLLKQGKESLVETLDNNEGINSDELEYNNFSKLGKRENGVFKVNKELIKVDGYGEKYFVVDGERYYESGIHVNRYMMIEDNYGMPHFYIGEVDEDGSMMGRGVIILCDGSVFKGEREKKGELKTEKRTYNGNFEEGRPVDKHTKPAFLRKGEYLYKDDSSETYVAFPLSIGMVQFINATDEKKREDRSRERGSMVGVERVTPDGNVSYEFHSWHRDCAYYATEDDFVFQAAPGCTIKLPKYQEKDIDRNRYTEEEIKAGHGKGSAMRKCRDRARYFAHLVNAIGNFIKDHKSVKFSASGDNLKVKYGEKFLKVTLIKEIPEKLDIQAKDFAEWLNVYYGNDVTDYKKKTA